MSNFIFNRGNISRPNAVNILKVPDYATGLTKIALNARSLYWFVCLIIFNEGTYLA